MLPIEDIIRTALNEHDHQDSEAQAIGIEQLIQKVKDQLSDPSSIKPYSKTSTPLSVVSFRCLLQDTGYPMEVYLPGDVENGPNIDWSKLKERWVGWGVEIPGEQPWTKGSSDLSDGLGELSIKSTSLPPSVHGKYPLPGHQGEYLGALLKVYDDVTYKPASIHDFIGLVSTSSLPSNEPEDADIVPTIHVLSKTETSPSSHNVSTDDETTREELLDYLATAFTPPDRTAAEYLLLLLLSSPTARPTSLPVLGTLAVNFRRQDEGTTSQFNSVVSAITPRVVPLPLTLPLLHSHRFVPSMTDTTGLDAGLLQLGEGTLLVVEEDAMGNGGALNEKAIKNLKSLMDCISEQRVKYEYPYMDDLKMDCAVRVAVVSQGKSLLPVDIDIPIRGDGAPLAKEPSIAAFRSFVSRFSSLTHALRLSIPEETSQLIQDHFVEERKTNAADAEATLTRRMRVARIVALSYPHATLTGDVWARAVKLDEDVAKRHTMS